MSNEYNNQKQRGTASCQVEKKKGNQVYWTVWIQWLGTSEPQKYEGLVDTGA